MTDCITSPAKRSVTRIHVDVVTKGGTRCLDIAHRESKSHQTFHKAQQRHIEDAVEYLPMAIFYYRAMLCIRGTSHGPVSVCVCVCHKPVFY